MFVLLMACSEHGLDTLPPVPEIVDEDDGTPGEPGSVPTPPAYGDPNGDPGSGNPGDPDLEDPPEDTYEQDDPTIPPSEVPPSDLPHDCSPDQLAVFSSDEIWVGAHGNTTATGQIESPDAGWYHVYNTHIVESGSSQSNESAYFRVQNDTNPSGLPATGNCDDEYVVVDGDNNGPPAGNQTLIGTFWIDSGSNDLVMTHYCELYDTGACPQHHIVDPSNQTCDTNNINSVHFMGFGLCLVPADL